MNDITILGAGLAGLAAAKKGEELGFDVTVYEKNRYIGGRAYSHNINGFIFDEGPHVSFTKDNDIREILAKSCDNKYFELNTWVFNYWKNLWLRHPIQDNMYGMPKNLIEEILLGFVDAYYDKNVTIHTYADWLYANFGKIFAKEFPFRYTRKFWTTDAYNMSIDWIGERVHKPSLKQIIHGALTMQQDNLHYISDFRYPMRGGFVTYITSLIPGNIKMQHEACLIDTKTEKIEFKNGTAVYYENLISSIPLTELVRKIKDVPKYVLEAADKLICTSVELINIGIGDKETLPKYHWFYVYDEDISFARGNLPHLLSIHNVPKNCSSLQLEIYHSKYKPLKSKDVLNKAIEDLYKMELLHKNDKIVTTDVISIPFANILFDLDREKYLAIIKEYLTKSGIKLCGRYGEWDYYWSDDSIRSGWRAVEDIASSNDWHNNY